MRIFIIINRNDEIIKLIQNFQLNKKYLKSIQCALSYLNTKKREELNFRFFQRIVLEFAIKNDDVNIFYRIIQYTFDRF